jgi:hypothetical protein
VRAATWIEQGRLLAGRHPGGLDPADAPAEVGELLARGVTLFLDLTEDRELPSYAHLIPPARRLRIAIRDFTAPDEETLVRALDAIDAELAAKGVVYVHCWAGCGRTGVVAGCWLIRHGAAPAEARDRIAKTRGLGCPQTLEQRLAILGWPAGR